MKEIIEALEKVKELNEMNINSLKEHNLDSQYEQGYKKALEFAIELLKGEVK